MNAVKSHDHFNVSKKNLQSPFGDDRRAPAPGAHKCDVDPEWLIELAQLDIKRRADRSRYLPQEFTGDAPWAILLDLFVFHQRRILRTLADLCSGSSISPSTAMRWLVAMEQAGLVKREAKHADPRRHTVALTDEGLASVHSILCSYL
ncbi:MAG: winged helix DNA-binding protein [Parvularcula sp.]|nr:winged helix DNA-binding protein [Parvularcula sp.]